MQEAIEKFIDIQGGLGRTLDDIEDDIHEVEKVAIRKAREKQYREWRKKNE